MQCQEQVTSFGVVGKKAYRPSKQVISNALSYSQEHGSKSLLLKAPHTLRNQAATDLEAFDALDSLHNTKRCYGCYQKEDKITNLNQL